MSGTPMNSNPKLNTSRNISVQISGRSTNPYTANMPKIKPNLKMSKIYGKLGAVTPIETSKQIKFEKFTWRNNKNILEMN
jgi:hypothetical protein